jgi:hypothetical protein
LNRDLEQGKLEGASDKWHLSSSDSLANNGSDTANRTGGTESGLYTLCIFAQEKVLLLGS